MSVHVIPAADAMARLDSFSAVIDARSEDEFALDHLPGAVNWPSPVVAQSRNMTCPDCSPPSL